MSRAQLTCKRVLSLAYQALKSIKETAKSYLIKAGLQFLLSPARFPPGQGTADHTFKAEGNLRTQKPSGSYFTLITIVLLMPSLLLATPPPR